MKRTRIRREPCVMLPANDMRGERHFIHGTEWRAQRNALAVSWMGARYHVHETTVRTLWGWLRRTPR